MTDNLIAIWQQMYSNSQRRIQTEMHDVFCVKDSRSKYGLMLQFPEPKGDYSPDLKIRGLSIITRPFNGKLELYILLNDIADLDLFTVLSKDIILTAGSCDSSDRLFKIVLNRLLRWQMFLAKNTSLTLSQEVQMGLFSELLLLLEYLAPSIGISSALNYWSGPDFAKNDFSVPECFIEVKSLISSKGPYITISSIHQLDAEVKPIWLSVYHLTKSDQGRSIEELVAKATEMIGDDVKLMSLLSEKLANYGYLQGVTDRPFYKWIVDYTAFYTVTSTFPKITAGTLAPQILDAVYRIDLSRCQEFEVAFNSIPV